MAIIIFKRTRIPAIQTLVLLQQETAPETATVISAALSSQRL